MMAAVLQLATIYASIGALLLFVATLCDKKARRVMGEAAFWTLAFAAAWPLFLLLVAMYHREDMRRG